MKISEINFCPVKEKEGLLGFCNFLLHDNFYVGGVAIMSRPNGEIRLCFPTRVINNKSIPICHPITKDLGEYIQQEVAKEYEKFRNLYINKTIS